MIDQHYERIAMAENSPSDDGDAEQPFRARGSHLSIRMNVKYVRRIKHSLNRQSG